MSTYARAAQLRGYPLLMLGTPRQELRAVAWSGKGLWVGDPLPFGYDMKDGKIVILEDEAEQDGRKRFNGHSESLVSERFLRRA